MKRQHNLLAEQIISNQTGPYNVNDLAKRHWRSFVPYIPSMDSLIQRWVASVLKRAQAQAIARDSRIRMTRAISLGPQAVRVKTMAMSEAEHTQANRVQRQIATGIKASHNLGVHITERLRHARLTKGAPLTGPEVLHEVTQAQADEAAGKVKQISLGI